MQTINFLFNLQERLFKLEPGRKFEGQVDKNKYYI